LGYFSILPFPTSEQSKWQQGDISKCEGACDVKGKFDQGTEEQIESTLPDLSSLGNRILSLTPDFVSVAFTPESSIPVAVPCLHDALHVTYEGRYAISEALKNLTWYRKYDPAAPNERAAIFHGRFYATAAASCLYAAAEDVANAIIEMFELDRQKIESENDKQTSIQSKVGKYLSKNMTSEPICSVLQDLAQSEAWRKTMHWRNRWVHEQSPVEGLGQNYERVKRWKSRTNEIGREVFTLRMGCGDIAEYTVDDVLEFVRPAFAQFVGTLDRVTNRYVESLTEAGFICDPKLGKSSFRF
jgi:hypothetical protein